MEGSKRIFYFDELRALAIIGIVFCHASVAFVLSGVGKSDFYISAFFDCFRDFSIPIFVMLSGALLIGKKDSFRDFFKKRLSRIFIPFVFWVFVYIIYSSIYITHGFSLSSAIYIFFGTTSTLGVAFWFIWMIIIAYFGIFIINKIMQYNVHVVNILTVISFIYILICQFSLFDPYSSKIVYFVSFISYVLIGNFIATNDYLERKISVNKLAIITLIFAIASYSTYVFYFVVPMSVSHGQFITLSYFNVPILFISLNVFLFFKFLSESEFSLKNNKIKNVITTISMYSFGIYLTHYVILHSLRMNMAKIIDFTSQSPLIWIPLFVILTVLISLIILAILDRIPYLNKFSGNS